MHVLEWKETLHLLVMASSSMRLVRGTGRDEASRPTFGTPKKGGTSCSTGQNSVVFLSRLPPGTGCSTGVEHNIF